MPRRTLAEEIAAARREAGLPPLESRESRRQKNPHRLKVVEASQGVPPQSPPRQGPPHEDTPERAAPKKGGYYPTFNELDDTIIPEMKLNPYEQTVLRRLYRLSRGWKSQTCTVGMTAIALKCVISRNQVKRTIQALLSRGLIHVIRQSQEGTTYRVLPDIPGVPQEGIPQQGTPRQARGGPQEKRRGVPHGGTNKDSKDLINTDKKEDEKLMDAEEIKRILAKGE